MTLHQLTSFPLLLSLLTPPTSLQLMTRLSQLEDKADETIKSVMPMFIKLEEAKQKYEDMLKVVTSASTLFSYDSNERSQTRKRMASGISDQGGGDIEEEGSEESSQRLTPTGVGTYNKGRTRMIKISSAAPMEVDKDDKGGE